MNQLMKLKFIDNVLFEQVNTAISLSPLHTKKKNKFIIEC